ncbi:MAG: hypothetical protein HYW27_04455 [Candidatus Aenigmarchaeota archaeon]|nr:hypothetical protein [Candidatus Aenigmarchaeota archaeon]
MKQLYVPGGTPMNVVVFFSGGASSLRAMLEDPEYGKSYRVTGAYTDKKGARGVELCNSSGITVITDISRRQFYRKHGLDPGDWNSRRRFYEMLDREIEQFRPDAIALSGYMHIVTEPILQHTTLNVHPADLTILESPEGAVIDASLTYMEGAASKYPGFTRKFKGEDAVYDAIASLARETRSTVHVATENFDEGPIVVQSKPFDIEPDIRNRAAAGDMEGVREYAEALQERMKVDGDGPAYLKALGVLSAGRLSMEGCRLFVDEAELPYCGIRLG